MSKEMADKAWQEMQNRIEQLLPRFLSGEVQHLEYKPVGEILLLDMLSERGKKNEQMMR
jgi:hypothetical protein